MKILRLNLQLQWLHFTFNRKYPVKSTEPEKWLRKYNIYLKKCMEVRKQLESLKK